MYMYILRQAVNTMQFKRSIPLFDIKGWLAFLESRRTRANFARGLRFIIQMPRVYASRWPAERITMMNITRRLKFSSILTPRTISYVGIRFNRRDYPHARGLNTRLIRRVIKIARGTLGRRHASYPVSSTRRSLRKKHRRVPYYSRNGVQTEARET